MPQLLLPYPVSLSVDCRTSREATARVTRHGVTIQPDGSVSTPHDLETERIAAALGGYLTCLDLADRGVPALDRWVRLVLRQEELPVVSLDDGGWLPAARADCCNRHGYRRPEVAFAHGRSPSHLATLHGVDDDLLRELIDAGRVPEPKPPREEPAATLWQSGFAPEVVARVQAAVRTTSPMTASDALAILGASRDLAWLDDGVPAGNRRLRGVLARLQSTAEPEADPLEDVDPETRSAWARSGLPTWMVGVLMPAGYRPEDVVLVASSWNVTHATAGVVLASWTTNGYRVAPGMLCGPRLRHLRMPPGAPSPHAVDRLRSRLVGIGRTPPPETELALSLVEHGTVGLAFAAIRRSTP